MRNERPKARKRVRVWAERNHAVLALIMRKIIGKVLRRSVRELLRRSNRVVGVSRAGQRRKSAARSGAKAEEERHALEESRNS